MCASVVLVLVSLVLQQYCAFATFYPEQNSIIGENGQVIQLTQPPRYIDCRDVAGSCSITLNIAYMQTMTVYEYDPDSDRDIGGRRAADGYIVNLNTNGSLQFQFEAPSLDGHLLYPILADGSLERRLVIAINNQVPGPTIIGRQGQNLQAKVVNNLPTESLAIHWHGLHQRGTPWMDGVAQLTHCPITSHTSFTYNFTLDQVGTHWYHGHNGPQRSNGFFGALVVTSTSEFTGINIPGPSFQDLPEQHTLTFFDWQSRDFTTIMETIFSGIDFINPADSSQVYETTRIYGGAAAAPLPYVSGMINGAGWRYTPGPSNGSQTSCTRESAQNTPLAVFNVTEGNRYRFRLVGAQSAYAFRFSIQGHKMTLLSSDGVPVQETVSQQEGLDYIIINSGERYDVLVQADLPSSHIATGYYWMIAETLEDPELLENSGYCIIGHRAYALLHYTDQSDALSSWPPPETAYDPIQRCSQNATQNAACFMANCPFKEFPNNTQPRQIITCVNVGDMQRRVSKAIPDTDVSAPTFLNFGFAPASINGRLYLHPPSPVVTQYADLTEIWNDNFCYPPKPAQEPEGRRCTHTYQVETQTVELVLMNYFPNFFGFAAHPLHLHGHYFRVVEVGYGNCTFEGCTNTDIVCGNFFCDVGVGWSSSKQQPNISSLNYGPEKDTVVVPPGGYVVIRFERDNPGWWFLHCHVEPHLLEGMTMVINESAGMPEPPADFPRCNNYPTNAPSQSPPAPTLSTCTPYYTVTGLVIGLTMALFLLVISCIGNIFLCYYAIKVHRAFKATSQGALSSKDTANIDESTTKM